jgi:hypothetical protein
MSSIRASAPLTGAPPAAAGGTAAPKRSTALPSVHDALRGIPKFSAQLELAVAESLPEKMSEPLYAPDFDPIAHLNQVVRLPLSSKRFSELSSELRSL